MKKMLAFTLVLLLLFTAAALAEEPYVFSFRGITWDAAPEDVAEAEGISAEDFYTDGNVSTAMGKDYEAGEYSFVLGYGFVDNRLTGMELYHAPGDNEDPRAVLDDVAKELSEEYGEPDAMDYETVNKILIAFDPDSPVILTEEDMPNGCTWLLPDQRTFIFLLYFDNPVITGIEAGIFDLDAISQCKVSRGE